MILTYWFFLLYHRSTLSDAIIGYMLASQLKFLFAKLPNKEHEYEQSM